MWAPHVVELRVDEGWLHVTTAPAPISRHHAIDLSTIVAVEELNLGRGRKIAGTGLPGYCVGTFSYAEIGRVWQATDCSRPVLVLRRTNDNPVVLTPPDRDRFRAALENGSGYHESQPPPDTGRGWFFDQALGPADASPRHSGASHLLRRTGASAIPGRLGRTRDHHHARHQTFRHRRVHRPAPPPTRRAQAMGNRRTRLLHRDLPRRRRQHQDLHHLGQGGRSHRRPRSEGLREPGESASKWAICSKAIVEPWEVATVVSLCRTSRTLTAIAREARKGHGLTESTQPSIARGYF